MGYFEGRAHSKQWLVSDEDVKAMYRKFSKGGRITLWCENIDSEREITALKEEEKEKGRQRDSKQEG